VEWSCGFELCGRMGEGRRGRDEMSLVGAEAG